MKVARIESTKQRSYTRNVDLSEALVILHIVIARRLFQHMNGRARAQMIAIDGLSFLENVTQIDQRHLILVARERSELFNQL